MNFNQIIREYFTFSRGERIGLIVLIGLILIFMLANQLVFYFEKPGVADKEQFEKLVAEFERQNEPPSVVLSLFAFDPNLVDSVALDSLDLPWRIKQNILKYRKRGGNFRNKSDVRKLYGMTDSIFDVIAGYISLPEIKPIVPRSSSPVRHETISEQQGEARNSISKSPVIVEINSATPDDLKKLSGIGPVLSERIVKYRNLLGGFYAADQLKEVYGVEPDLIDRLKSQLTVDATLITQLNVNFSEAKELAAHPYVKWENANKITAYRTQNGFIREVEQLLSDSVVNKEVFKKIQVYLKTKN
ncbi:helix-hairpin-helix domain-containing protein [Gaoshiqia sediminis]|uniref:Helix-hairpin-helix domain-containing protein n=1 Tax=Gaoshiqia sediminis TaxID=2986998 RepID=A0AA42C9X6_9BACT|nr:helix-hairpin-helix domain-containing protein [Gaoshiqia sediminis]MCW0484621.1 helix-hairpin-helix domain-containing protein [Gaoshiqia sediminis]